MFSLQFRKKNLLLYIFLICNAVIALLYFFSLEEIFSPRVPWGAEALGWVYKGPCFFFIHCLLWIVFYVFITYYPVKIHNKNLRLATIVASLGLVVIVLRYFGLMF